jgi:DNA-binding NtrC family response regulator
VKTTVLITADDPQVATRLRVAFGQRPDEEVVLVAGPRDARAALEGQADDGDVVLLVTGDVAAETTRRLVQAALAAREDVPVLYLAPDGRPPAPELALDLAIEETLPRSADPEEVALVAHRILELRRIQRETGIVGRSEAIREVLERIHQIAPVDSTVLVTGESGTGKELVARGLHRLSRRRGKPFIAVNCAAVPETLLESELFGHEKGAFTGASSLRKGMFELANGGTIFLDEIAEMPRATQTKLLRVLEQREFMRVGGERPIHVDVRVIAATNRELRGAVELGDFRRDLYYRIAVLHIHLPALRERREDIPLLVRAFVREFSRQHDRPFKGIAPEAMEILVRYDWPGNVRELRNLVESMVVLAPGSVIRPEDIPAEVRSGGRRLVPVPAERPLPRPEAGGPPAEMEFIFRTLVELKLDVEDLRREFEEYKRRHPELLAGRPVGPEPAEWVEWRPSEGERAEPAAAETPPATEPAREPVPAAADAGAAVGAARENGAEPSPPADREIRFRPGMKMDELERAAIEATLRSVGGNRRKAAEALGIGERTLYRKIKEYGIEA